MGYWSWCKFAKSSLRDKVVDEVADMADRADFTDVTLVREDTEDITDVTLGMLIIV